MKNISRFRFLILLILSLNAYSQKEHVFREGLAISNCHQYARQAVNTDLFVYNFFAGQPGTPKAGAVAFKNTEGRDVAWKEIKADTSGTFRGREGSNGYIYLTYNSEREQGCVVSMTGNSMFYLNGEPHCGDPNMHGWMYVPVKLRKGLNEFYVRTSRIMFQGIKAKLVFPGKPVFISSDDATLPHIVPGNDNDSLIGAVVLLNTGSKSLNGLVIKSVLNGEVLTADVPPVLPFCSRKVMFRFDGSSVKEKGTAICDLSIISKGKTLNTSKIKIEAVSPEEPYSCTFISNIDGSVQYFAVNPRKPGNDPGALFLSVHGAGVEAIGQARAYRSKDWGVLVAPTNRRPRGFNWEDWGRIDALEVLDIAVRKFNPDPSRIYLTGHSMGGHGTWFLGATYPGKWAAIAPCAGYPTLITYGSADGAIPVPGERAIEKTILRASNGSNVPRLSGNYMAGGVYVFHGDADRTVSVEFARQMRQILGTMHNDFSYYEYPGGSHWWSNESVDWDPLFSYLRWHTIKPDSTVNNIDFTTVSPSVSSSFRWASVIQQKEPFEYSHLKLRRNKKQPSITGETENITRLKLDISDLPDGPLKIELDGDIMETKKNGENIIYTSLTDHWKLSKDPPPPGEKGQLRNGTFKEPFNNRMVFVYGTEGDTRENEWALAKARYDAETWYYRGNGSVDIVADKDFRPSDYPDRGVIIYGNSSTNAAWKVMLSDCPVQVSNGSVSVGTERFTGGQYGAYLMYPRKDSRIASVAAVTGTGLEGMHATDANQYFTGGSGYPDYMIFSSDMAVKGYEGVVKAGYFGNDWQLK